MKIGLIFPNKDRRYKTIHLGLAYLVAYAQKQHSDLEFKVLDTRVATSSEIRNFFRESFDLVGITVFSPVYHEVINIFRKIRKERPLTKICLGGPYVTTMMSDIFLRTPADFAVYGEGEITFSELIDSLKNGGKYYGITGLMFTQPDGSVAVNPPRTYISDLNEIPFPAWEYFPMERYPLHRMVTTRGCLYSCAWCNSSSVWRKGYRTRSPENIVDEIELLVKNFGKKIFVFGDNTFNGEPERVEAICDLLLKRKIRILWSASFRADLMTPSLALKMKEAGCYNASIGIESANNEILAKMNKRTTIEQISAGVAMLKKAGIEVLSQFVIGSPYETLETVRESVEYAKNSQCDYTNFYTVLPFRGTPQWEYVKTHGKFLVSEIHDFHTVNPRVVFETPEFPYADRVEAIKLVQKEGFYSNKDKKSWWFDYAKETGRKIQGFLPESAGKRVYSLLKSIYKIRFVKKNNI